MPYVPLRLDRRTFLRRATDLCACAIGAYAMVGVRSRTHAGTRTTSPSLRVGLMIVGRRDEYPTAAMGIGLGIDEATRAASLLGYTVEVASRAASVASALALVRRGQPSALVCAVKTDDIIELGRECARLDVPLFNLVADDNSLRGERCSRSTFHICASQAMRDSALRFLADSAARPATTIELWHHRLERFGAAQLNERFQSRFHRPMDSLAWAGWFGVKVAWEASLRARSADGSGIAGYLERDIAHFDGQKGVPLSFRRWNHQLRQPLYAVAASGSSEPMSIPTVSAGSSRDALDALGPNEQASSCHWR